MLTEVFPYPYRILSVNGIVTIDVNGTPVTATISMGSIKNLDIKPGVKACAVVKATEVMVLEPGIPPT